MALDSINTDPSRDAVAEAGQGKRQSPPTQVRFLLPVWGYKYLRDFLNIGLRTWLSEGNIPAVAASLPTEFVFLTSREDEPYLVSHAAFRQLSAVCKTSVHFIDHLITGVNYSTTITLAYTEAVRSVGRELTDTCFFFLVSDYIVADGSFRNALRRVERGASGVLVGNFQLVEEDALPWIEAQIGRSPRTLSLSSRELMRWGLSHLHPATIANIANSGLSHNHHTNRLFWSVDNGTLIGRFYLMHMICIRPELEDFIVASSCDYAFIPEMCPSGNVEIIEDSDEYLVIELQPRFHESSFLKSGPLSPGALAKTLEEWTTDRHRKNAETAVVFHADDVPKTLPESMKAFDTALTHVKRHMKKPPRPHRAHPYWAGAVASQKDSTGLKLTQAEWRLALGLPNADLEDNVVIALGVEVIRFMLLGTPPNVGRLHPRWKDYNLILERMRFDAPNASKTLLLSNRPTAFSAGVVDGGEHIVRFRSSELRRRSAESLQPLSERFDLCLVECAAHEILDVDAVLDRAAPLMKDGGKILVSIVSGYTLDRSSLGNLIAQHAPRLFRPYARKTTSSFVILNTLSWWSLNQQLRIAGMFKPYPIRALLAAAIFTPFILLENLIENARKTKLSPTLKPGQTASSALIEIEVDSRAAADAVLYSKDRLLRDRIRARRGLAGRPVAVDERAGQTFDIEDVLNGRVGKLPMKIAPTPSISEKDTHMAEVEVGTREPQYNRCLEIKSAQGLTSLGLMTNQVWEDDPRRLTFLLSRYKFVSKMLSGKKIVGELGCGDAFGTRVVMQEVEKVIAYDFDQAFISDIKERYSDRWPVEAHYHDILESPLPTLHDGIYSLDVIEHIPSVDEDTYVKNLSASLSADGVLIIGTPSLESQSYASPPSKAGHVNCKTGPELKALLRNYFQNVFIFSMNDEVVHTGFSPMAHYLFAICCQKTPGVSKDRHEDRT